MVCSAPLMYLDQAEDLTCAYCRKVESGHIKCPHGHYICDVCHNRDAVRIIEDVAISAQSKDPFGISELMMSYPGLPMLGCQHAYIAGGALMAALKNKGTEGIGKEAIKEVFSRTERQAHGGYCGLTGVCGIAPAIGACFAVLTGSKCGKDEEQKITMEAATRVAGAITSLTGPSCCKAYVRTSLDVAVNYLKEGLGIELPKGETSACKYSPKHPHGCRTSRCPYFDGSALAEEHDSDVGEAILFSEKDGKTMEHKMEALIKRALELGAEKAKVIDTDTVSVNEWVRWKCLYGCPFHGKDAYHPPCAPDAESTQKVLKEYSKAILMNSSKGKALTEAAGRLEGEAYQLGYYKAFALTAITSGLAGAT